MNPIAKVLQQARELLVTTPHDKRCVVSHCSGVARGQGATAPWQELCPPLAPNEITLCTEVYGEPPFWVPVSPSLAHPWAPLAAPHFEKSGYAPVALNVCIKIEKKWISQPISSKGLCPTPGHLCLIWLKVEGFLCCLFVCLFLITPPFTMHTKHESG